MVEKMVGNSFVLVLGLKAIRKGDVFRTTDAGQVGPVLVAQADAQHVAHPVKLGSFVWSVRTAS